MSHHECKCTQSMTRSAEEAFPPSPCSEVYSVAEQTMHRDELKRRLAELKAHRDQLLVDYVMCHPEMGYEQVGKQFGLVAEHVSLIARRRGVTRKRGKKPNPAK